MDTKRCAKCHKLSRAEAETCSRCGYSFAVSVSWVPASPASRGGKRNVVTPLAGVRGTGNRNGRVSKPPLTTQRRSIPPASPHRAGHYSGLHPEDQPYQSAMIAVQRLPAPKTNALVSLRQQSESSPLLPAGIAWGQEGSRSAIVATPEPDLYEQPTLPVSLPSPTPPITPLPLHPPAYVPEKPSKRGGFVPTVLTVSCLLLLVASSLLAYIYINKKP